MRSLFLGFLLITALASNAQVKNAVDNLKQQAGDMGQAFVKEDYATFAKYMHPKVVQAAGGTAKIVEAVKMSMDQMKKSSGMSITKVVCDAPNKLVKSGNEWQSTLQQHTTIKVAGGRIVTTSTLIAVSTDNGVNWKFVDCNRKTMADIRKFLPNLSKDIVIPEQQAPVQYKD